MNVKRVFKIAGIVLSILLLLLIGAAFYVTHWLPKSTLSNIQVEITPQRVERGKYLANHVTVCIDCHSTRDWDRYSGPVVQGSEGMGGEVFSKDMGFPGRFVSKNITPFKLKNWTDAEIFRAITQGISKDGHPMFPVMPYPNYGKLDKEDVYSIIAYLRTLPEINNTPEQSQPDFPMNIILHLIPQEPSLSVIPKQSNTLAYGQYMVNAAGCIECHTIANNGKIDISRAFAGGREFPTNFGIIVSANITPSKTTGIGNWSAEAFVARFKAYNLPGSSLPKAENVGYNTMMPWSMYAGMDSTDLLAIYKYLRSVKPIENKVSVVKAKI